jgi:peptide/nickel transport system permease protein
MKRSHSLTYYSWLRLRRNYSALLGLGLFLVFIMIALVGGWLAPYEYRAQVAELRQPPNSKNWLGTDPLGRDILSRLLTGARYTLGVGIATVAIGIAIGIPLGLMSGFLGGRVDNLIMRVMDVLLSFPDILLALALMAALGPSLTNAMIAIGIISIPKFARIMRASTLQVKTLDYVQAAVALGCSRLALLYRHVLPNSLAPIIVVGTLGLASAILQASALSFLGLGAQPPLPEWGARLSEGKEYYTTAPHIMVFPGLAIALSVLGINLFGDGLRDAMDVKLSR